VRKRFIAGSSLAAVLLSAHSALGQDMYQLLDFTTLSSWDYPSQTLGDTTPPKVDPSGVPRYVWAYDGKKISMEGLVLPLDYNKDGASVFIFTLDQDTCAFGIMPRINEWIMVTMVGGQRARLKNGFPYRLTGTFHVTENTDANGRVVELYAIDAETVDAL
jgi:hypothetical protein